MYPRSDNRSTNTKAADLLDFLTASCRREYLNKVFENEHTEIANCCDLCDDPLPASNKPDYRMKPKASRWPAPKLKRSRCPEQQLEAKKKIEAWRSLELQELESFRKYMTRVAS